MSWTKTSDDLPDRLWSLSDAAFRMHSHATVWSNRLLTDGEIPADRLRVLVPRFRVSAVVELESAGLWSKTETGYRIEGFLVDQPSQREVKARREYDAIRQAISAAETPDEKVGLRLSETAARKRWQEARKARAAAAHSVSTAVSDGVTHKAPSHTRPVNPHYVRGTYTGGSDADSVDNLAAGAGNDPLDGVDELVRGRGGWSQPDHSAEIKAKQSAERKAAKKAPRKVAT